MLKVAPDNDLNRKQTGGPRYARDKIKSIEELGRIAAEVRARGEHVVLAHGVFDLLHMGHVRHLEEARRQGSVLFVTVTADGFVNKGPGRPVFPDHLRAEMVASVECVDWVGVNDNPSAETVLMAIKPDVYVKGSDYRHASDDVTGKIVAEQELVESYGGRIVFTDEIMFSSSSLINRYLNIYEPSLQELLEHHRTQNTLERLTELFDRIKDYRILFIGDAIIDEYQYVMPLGKSPKENMIANLYQRKEVFAGGVFAAANHVASFCRHVEIITSLGEGDSHEGLIRSSLKPNVHLTAIHQENIPTTRKCRFIDTSYSPKKLFEVYFMDDRPLPVRDMERLRGVISDRIRDYDVVVVTDFGHGLLHGPVIGDLIGQAKFLAINTQSNSANHGYNLITKYQRADYVCIDGPEARLALQDKYSELDEIVSERLPAVIDCANIVVTQGKHGCLTFDRNTGLNHVPALTSTIVDTVGAGDAFFAVTAPFVAAGMQMADVGLIGNAAGALKVGIVGHRSSVEKPALLKFLTALLK
jgi:rfaE bifunctional protein nucleotidyltransferase chain/domain